MLDPLPGEPHLGRVAPPARVARDLVGNQVAVHRPARARLEGLDVDESAVATAARRGEAIALVVVPGRDAPGQSHGEDFPRIFPPFPIEVNLAQFLNGENPIPFLAGAETTPLPGEKSSPHLACKGDRKSTRQYDKLDRKSTRLNSSH